jgi:S-methylmethionine-dependent homocysteine/selenocysteine methylase
VLDGGLSTELERRGYDLTGRLWSARLLSEAPEAVRAVHTDFLRAGADVITTASYQATPEGFVRAGFSAHEADRLLRRSVELAQQARASRTDGPVWVAGSVGPYGALLADGSEYTGDYGPDVDQARLRRFHRPRMELLAASGVDVLAVETVPSLLETEALITEIVALDHPAWLSLTTTTSPDGVVRTRRGELASEAFALAAEVEAIVAVGVNCTDPAGLEAAISVASTASGKPVIAYPNSGEGWNAETRSWTDASTALSVSRAVVGHWLDAGARMIGGCCRVGPTSIAEVARQLDRPVRDTG